MGVPTSAWVIAACAGVGGVFVAAGESLFAVAIAYLLGTRGRPLDVLPAHSLVFPDTASRQEHARDHHRSDVALRWLVGALVAGVLIWVVRVLTA